MANGTNASDAGGQDCGEEDDYLDFVLEVKCLDDGRTSTVSAVTGGIAALSPSEIARIRNTDAGALVIGEKATAPSGCGRAAAPATPPAARAGTGCPRAGACRPRRRASSTAGPT